MSGRRPNSDPGELDLWSNGSVFRSKAHLFRSILAHISHSNKLPLPVLCWRRKRRVSRGGTTAADKPRRAIESPREAPSSTLSTLRELTATVFNKVPLSVVCWFRRKGSITPRENLIYGRI